MSDSYIHNIEIKLQCPLFILLPQQRGPLVQLWTLFGVNSKQTIMFGCKFRRRLNLPLICGNMSSELVVVGAFFYDKLALS